MLKSRSIKENVLNIANKYIILQHTCDKSAEEIMKRLISCRKMQ